MYCLKSRLSILFTAATLSACTAGLQGGSITLQFAGISSAKVSSPESVELNWVTNDDCSGYNIYSLGTNNNDRIATASVPPLTVRAPLIESERNYTFAVGCVNLAGNITGADLSASVNTWAEFSGAVTSSIDTSATTPIVVLNWNYAPDNAPIMFNIYVQSAPLPNTLASWKLHEIDPIKHSYSDTKYCSIMANRARIGEGSCPALTPGQAYNFKVIAQYPDGSYSTDDYGRGTYIDVPSLMDDPHCALTMAGIGADASTASLFLTCSTAKLNNACPGGTMTAKAWQGITSGTTSSRIAVSDIMSGAGTLRIQPQINTAAANTRLISGLEVDFNCTAPSGVKINTVRYDGNTNPQPVLKFNDTAMVGAPKNSFQEIPSFYGKAVAIGDFNCDGIPDLAVGMPDVTFNQAPYFSQNPESGVVAIYYDYTVDADGNINSAVPPQYISFRDLPAYAYFGASLSAGNVNKDYYSNGNNAFACDDLIIGAPGVNNSSGNYGGEAYIFYGNPNKFPQPLNISALSVNSPTCSGTLGNSVCNPVRLYQDMQTDYLIPATETQTLWTNTNTNRFGFSVAYIRDFNADGFGDVAIGDPYCAWDGEVINGLGHNATGTVAPSYNKLFQVGCVYVYWGGPNGLQKIRVGQHYTASGLGPVSSTFSKIYPPFPQPNMHFGWSISGGGDIDGRGPVPLQNTAGNLGYANGNDFVVSAPDFNYNGAGGNNVFLGKGSETIWAQANPYPADPIVIYNEGNTAPGGVTPSDKITPPLNGAWTTAAAWASNTLPAVTGNTALANSTGIVFAYLGRSSNYEYSIQVNGESAPDNNAFYKLPLLGSSPGTLSVTDLLSLSLQSRQTGGRGFQLGQPLSSNSGTMVPQDNFYNCGSRGGYDNATTHSHYSCFAGRTNFSVIYPQVASTDLPVSQFGLNVTIAGSKEQNIPALMDMTPDKHTPYKLEMGGSLFMPLAQGFLHERLGGDSLWETGVHRYSYVDGTGSQSWEFYSSGVTSPADAANTDLSTSNTVRVTRSAISESYSGIPENSATTTPLNGYIQSDINRDGYADVIVSTGLSAGSSYVYTFFGNYAADFSYGDKISPSAPYSTSANCVVNTGYTSTLTSANAGSGGSLTGSALWSASYWDKIPYQIFKASIQAGPGGTSGTYTVTGTYPVRPTSGDNSPYRLAFLGDTVKWPTSSYPIGTDDAPYTQATFASSFPLILSGMQHCLPQRITYTTAATSMSVADVNDDRVADVVIGFANESSGTGLIRTLIADNGGSGFVSSPVYTNGAQAGATAGYSVAATNWRFVSPLSDTNNPFPFEKNRRDLFMGAPQQATAKGAVISYAAPYGKQFGSPVILTANLPFPSTLQMGLSKIIGDINGDGFDDIWIPVKRTDSHGNIYYDGIIYFGSAFGPVTTPMCDSQIANKQITYSNGGALGTSDCEASVNSASAMIAGIPVHLPQYFTSPLGMSSTWALRVEGAGDVDHDGRKDIIVFDNSSHGIYLLFGSDIGLVNGQPALGASSNHNPQIVTQNSSIISTVGTTSLGTGGTWPNAVNLPFAHGDFNGDGYEDVAIGVPGGGTTRMTGGWDCGPGIGAQSTNFLQAGVCGYVGNPPQAAVPPPIPGPASPGAGMVLVIYGGSTGLQTPYAPSSKPDYDWDNGNSAECDSFYQHCKLAGTSTPGFYKYAKMIYGSLTSSGSQYTLTNDDANLDVYNAPACQPGSGTNVPNTCNSTIITNPAFYDTPGAYYNVAGMNFGTILTVADMNGDGVDDLIVGYGLYAAYGTTGQLTALASGGTTLPSILPSTEANNHGAAMLYYGAKSHGLVAPTSEAYIGPAAMGVSSIGGNANHSASVFTIYPMFPSIAPSPMYEGSEAGRRIGSNITSGDYNGDGYDDIAIASENGTVYVYYGPICALDNDKNWLDNNSTQPGSTIKMGMYNAPNLPLPMTVGSDTCSAISLGATNTGVVSPVINQNKLRPQMIQIAGVPPVGGTMNFASTLLSMRKGAGNIKNIGTVGGVVNQHQGASDLIIAGPSANDPNASILSYKNTGLGYVLFGHQANDTDFTTTGGLYVGNASYDLNIATDAQGNFHYTPLLLRPHTPDSSIGRFYNYQVTTGDVNGDGRMDIIFPTDDLSATQDPSVPATYGGGFRLFY